MTDALHVLSRPTVDDTLTRKAAAAYMSKIGCPVSPRTLKNWSSNLNQGKGPAFIQRRGRFVGYRRSDLDAWVKRETRRVE